RTLKGKRLVKGCRTPRIVHTPKTEFRCVTEQIDPEFARSRKKPQRLVQPVDVFRLKRCLAGFEVDQANFACCICLKARRAKSVCHNIISLALWLRWLGSSTGYKGRLGSEFQEFCS